ncbi:MAG: DNA-directed DNA polymerase II small subunit [Candidatus Thermoplasmatota archaeon]|nr:DNA-directed DNA polymerase II small subunit [Candidatus Thermoplasmatota archaeon]
MKEILRSFSEHGTFVQPDALKYIMSKENPGEFSSFIIKNLQEYPLILTVDQIKNIEQQTTKTVEEQPKIQPPVVDSQIEKEVQKKVLSTIYGKGELHIKTLNDENGEEDEEPDDLDQTEASDLEAMPKLISIEKVKGWKPKAAEYESEIEIIKDVTGKSTCEGTTKDFTKLFVDRYHVLRKLLQSQRREMVNVMPISRIKHGVMKEVQIIGIVKDVRTTVNGHRLIEIEDETDTVTCIALKTNHETVQMANEVVFDEIIGVKGHLSKNGDLVIINSIVFPEISIQHEKNKSEVPVFAAFLSDIHIGSKMFMESEWQAFLRWFNGAIGNSRQRDVAGRIKYLVVPGDVVDGIGIYPNQEKELSITDVYRQYEALAEQFKLIPDHISIIMQPGNHDAVRPAEPQPTFEKEIRDLFSGKDIRFVGNPCYFSLNGVEVLSYHGQSLLDFATNIQSLKYNEPIETMKVMLRKHHLAPTYGGYTPLAPEHSDYMIIDRVPDIFVTGHVHVAKFGDYRGVTLINASSWQSQTSYQKMLNFVPDSAKLPIVDLKTGNVTMMDFSKKLE